MAIDFNFFDELPDNWETARVKNILDYNHHYPIGDGDHGSIKPEMYQDDGIPYLRVQNLSWGFDINYDNLVYISDEVNLANSKSILIPDDILIAKTGATVGKMAIIPKSMPQANTTSSVGKITINQKLFNIKYFAYLFSSPMFQEQIKEKAYQKSAQPGFNIDDLIEFKIIIPPFNAQQQLANYLDKKTAKIDATIAKNEELIQLLEEKRVALINQVVTKGLNPDVPMKDSGVEWIGEIPEHWDMMKISNIFNNIGSGTTPKSSNDEYYIDGNVNWLITGDLNDNYIHNTSTKITKKALHDTSALKIYPKESLVIAMYGATIGKLGILNIETCTNQACCVLSRSKIMNIKYTYYWFLGYRNEIISLSYGGGQPNISQDVIKNLKCIVPPFNEQKQIIDYLDTEITKINKTITKVTENINLLEEYKTSLIHHVVTGKIDVRGEEI